MFDISVSDELHTDEDLPDYPYYRGKVILGAFDEPIRVMAGAWKPSDYRAHWVSQAIKLRGVSDRVAMLCSEPGPNVEVCGAWVLWREGTVVYIQEHNIWRDHLGAVRDLSNPDLLIEARRSTTEDGDVISQWTVPISDIEDFVLRQS